MRPSDLRRFVRKFERRSRTECWPWTAAYTRGGYGHFWFNGRILGAHRFAKAVADGIEIPGREWEIDHLCENPPCVNPAHLEWVPRKGRINSVRHQQRRFGNRTTCPNGHPWIEKNIYRFTYASGKNYTACRICRNAAARRAKVGA